MTNPDNRHTVHLKEVFIAVILLAAAAGFASIYKFSGVNFMPLTESNVLAIVSSMFVVAVFMERAVDAILTPIRAPDQDRIEQKIYELQEKIKKGLEDNEQTKLDLIEEEKRLMDYARNTNQRFYWLSLTFGLVLSVIGVRALSGLVDPQGFSELKDMQQFLFRSTDVVLTGGIIAGGSAAIDKLGQRFTSFYTAKKPDE